MQHWPSRANELLENLVEGSIGITLGENLLEQSREYF